MKETGKGPAILRLNNEKRVMAALRRLQVTSRQDLSRYLALSKNTVSLIIDELIEAGLIEERGPVASYAAGRRKIEIALRPDRLLSAGIMIERQQIHLRVCDYFSRVLKEETWSTQTRDPASLFNELGLRCQLLTHSYPALLGIAIGFPGIIDPQRGWMHHSSHLGWRDVDILSPLQAMLTLPLWVMNNVKAAALLGVQRATTAETAADRFYLRVAEGVGGALIQRGEVYTGSSWTAGEVGHLIVQPAGEKCTCGRKGCLETVISIPAVQRQLARHAPGLSWQNRASAPQIVDAVMRQIGELLGNALGQIMLLLNPADIVIDCPWNIHSGFVETVRTSSAVSALTFTSRRTGLHFLREHIDPAQGLALAVIEHYERPMISVASSAQ
ncbi:ROK family transcriptional regulator [Erwinia sp. HR93]|uniref:ROK family transcriptional regulator n=1 Tax=Erwinia sp. HR93 TaxID=3094840 RepID=UPI002ADECECD|nr:ROK family transcriptional regulator [Erwinia sp. HR93]MEA1064235.1 ROK family transcriptional regulator [Erwinia sp. HR93]